MLIDILFALSAAIAGTSIAVLITWYRERDLVPLTNCINLIEKSVPSTSEWDEDFIDSLSKGERNEN